MFLLIVELQSLLIAYSNLSFFYTLYMSKPDVSIDVLVESKKTYMEVFTSQLIKPIYNAIRDIYEDAVDYIERHPEVEEGVLYEFQSGLEEIKKWNDSEISDAVSKIIPPESTSKFDDLLEAVIIASVKIMTAIRLNNKDSPLDLTIPTIKKFVYNTLLESARKFYENPYLMDTRSNVDPIEQQKNLERSYQVIQTALQTTINNSIPTDEILSKALERPSPSEEDNVSMYTTTSEAENKKKEDLRDIIRKELENVLSEYASDDETGLRSRSTSPERGSSERSMSTERQGEAFSETAASEPIDLLSTNSGEEKRSSGSGSGSEKKSSSSDQERKSMNSSSEAENKEEENVKDIIVPASTRLASKKKAQEMIEKHKSDKKKYSSDTVFFSDSDNE